jgi:phosphoribosylformylglycinamidine synthase
MDFQFEVKVLLKKGALDAEGETVAKSLKLLGYPVEKVETIKTYRVTVSAKDEGAAKKILTDASEKLLANPVIQDYTIERV